MLKKILLPLDGSALAEKALPYARALAEKYEAELIIVRVVQPVPVYSDYGTAAYEAILNAERQEIEAYLAQIKKNLAGLQTPIRTVAREDLAVAEAIIELACQEKVDLIVMSTHGRSGISRWIHGSVATKVLQHAPCPVLLVRATGLKPNGAT